jgi:hypothetical protein
MSMSMTTLDQQPNRHHQTYLRTHLLHNNSWKDPLLHFLHRLNFLHDKEFQDLLQMIHYINAAI